MGFFCLQKALRGNKLLAVSCDPFWVINLFSYIDASLYICQEDICRKEHTWYSKYLSLTLHPAVSTETSASISTNDLFAILTSGEVFIYVQWDEGQKTLHTHQSQLQLYIINYSRPAVSIFFYGHLFTVIFRKTTYIICFWLLREKEKGGEKRSKLVPTGRQKRKEMRKREKLNVFSVTSITWLIIFDRLLIYWLLIGCGEEEER